jgi:hypothetical protein
MDFIENFVIRETCAIVRRANASRRLKWGEFTKDALDAEDWRNLEQEFGASRTSEFDPLRIRQTAWENFKRGSGVECRVFCSEVARVVVFFPDLAAIGPGDIPLGLWSRILEAFGGGGGGGGSSPKKRSIRIYLVASAIPRRFPEDSTKIGPQNINGGYCYPCRESLAIYIFRAEDATRVLIHELLHAFCTDRFEVGLDLVEARTEAWAEMAWCCFLAGGSDELAKKYFSMQIAWILGQSRKIIDYIGAEAAASHEFPWRYTIGREPIVKRWLQLGANLTVPAKTGKSLRLTSPRVVEEVFAQNPKFERSDKLI